MRIWVYALVFFLAGFFSIRYLLANDQASYRGQDSMPSTPPFSLKPPSESLTGRIIYLEGEVRKKPRDSELFQAVEGGSGLVQGEKLITGVESTAEIEFDQDFKLIVLPNSEISLVSLIPSHFLINQDKGAITYQKLAGQNPLNVRANPLLILIGSGEGKISQKPKAILIEQNLGNAEIGLVDQNNQTRTWHLEQGQKATFAKDQQSIAIEKATF